MITYCFFHTETIIARGSYGRQDQLRKVNGLNVMLCKKCCKIIDEINLAVQQDSQHNNH